jgi:hypothetical protein
MVALTGCSGGGGDGSPTVIVPPVVVRTPPDAPKVTSLVASDAQVTVGFSAPASDGNSPISSYTAVASPGGRSITGSAGPLTITGLTNYVAYTITVTASNATGSSPSSAPSASVTPVLPAPVAPTGVGASVAGTTVTLLWSSLSKASSYNVYWGTSPGITTSSTKIANISGATYQHSGLTPSTTYYYVVTANFVNGEGPISAEVSGQILPGGLSAKREVEPNGLLALATAITVGSGEMQGQLSADTDVDYYYIKSIGGVVSFSIRPDANVSEAGIIAATLSKSDGTILSSNNLSSSTSKSTELTLSATLPAITPEQTYYLKIDKSAAGAIFQKDYLITSSYVTSTREAEPNDTTAAATSIAIGLGEMRGQLYNDTDVDYFKVISTGGIIAFTIKPDPAVSEAGTISAVILAQDGTTVLSANVLTTTASSNTASLTLAANTETGKTYYLLISKSPAASIFRKDYIITSASN